MGLFKLVPLEDRIVFDGAIAHSIVHLSHPQVVHAATESQILGHSSATDLVQAPSLQFPEVLVVSQAVPDATLLASAAKAGVIVVSYDPLTATTQSLSAQILESLHGLHASRIAFVTDGANGEFNLLSQLSISSSTIEATPQNLDVLNFWHNIASDLAPNGSLDLLACDVAAGQQGQQFLSQFDQLINENGTHITVDASSNLVGNSAEGGSWNLDYSSNPTVHSIDAATLYFNLPTLAEWDHVLANPTITVVGTEVNPGVSEVFTISLSATEINTVTFNYATANGTAIAGTDYTAKSGSGSISAFSTSTTVTVLTTANTAYDPAVLNFTLTISSVTHVTLSGSTLTGTGQINDTINPAPTIAVNNVNVSEGPGGASTAAFTVKLTGATDVVTNYNFATSNGTALAGTDYTSTSGSNSFTAGAGPQTETITVPLLNTTYYKPTENFTVTLSGVTNVASSGNTLVGTATIANTNAAPTLAINNVSVNSTASTESFTVTRTGLTEAAATFNYATANGTATAGIDYTSESGSGTVAANTSTTNTTTITIPILNVANYNPNDFYLVNLSSLGGVNSTGNTTQGTGTIINNTPAPILSINNDSISEGPGGATNASFTVTLTGGTDVITSYNYATANGTALAGTDYTSTSGSNSFVASGSNQTETITVPLLDTTYYKATENFTVTLSGATNIASSGNTLTGTATIANTNSAPTLAINSPSVNSTAGTEVFTVTRTGLTEVATTFNYATANGTASAGVDYTAESGSGSVAANSSTTNTTAVTIPIINVANYNPNDTYFVNLSSLGNAAATGNTLQGTGTIVNSTAAPVLSISNASASEGPSGATTVSFTVTETGGSDLAATYNFATANGTALAGTDYTSSSGSNSFSPSSSNQTETITITLLNTLFYKPTENFTVTLSGLSGATGTALTGTATISNTNSAPTLAINSPSVNATAGTEVFTVTRTGLTELATTFNYATANNTATAGIDYTAESGSGSIAANGSSTNTTTITIPIINVASYNPNDTYFVNLSSLGNAAATGNTLQGTGTIVNSTAAPVISINNVSASEGPSGATSVTFTVTETGASEVAAGYNFATANGTALAGTDYTSTSGSNSFTPNSSTQTESITVTLLNTLSYKSTENFTVNLSGLSGATGTALTGTATISNTNAAPTLAINSVSVNSTAGTEVFTVTRTGLTELATTFNYVTANNTATAGIDYTAESGSGSVAANGSSTNTTTITIPIINVASYNPNDTYFVNLSSLGNAAATGNTLQGTGTIVNSTAAPVISINNISASEGPSGATNVTFTVTETGASEVAANYNFTTANGTALAGTDFTSTSGSNSFTPNSSTQTENITVTLLNTLYYKTTENFTVNLSGLSGATGTVLTGTATISNTNAAPTLAINSVSVNSTAGTEVFTVTRTGLTELATTFNYATANGTATAGVDYTAESGSGSVAANGASTNTTTLSIPIINVANYNPNDTYFVNLSSLGNAAATGNTLQGTGTIVNNTAAPVISINNVSASEGPSGATNVTFTVTETGGSDLAATYNFATANGTALAGTDYTSNSGSNSFSPSSSNQTENITVTLLNTLYYKTTENFSVALSGLSGATGTVLTGTATISNTNAAPTLAINSVSVNSTAGTEVFTVTRTGLTELATTFNYATANGTATAGVDYTAESGSGSVAANGSSTNTTTLSIPIINVANYNPNDTYFVNLSSLGNAASTGNTLQGTGTIVNSTAAPVISINNVSASEGPSGATNVTFTVTETGGSDLAATYNFATANGTALAGTDYTSTSGSNSFSPSSSNQTENITVTLLNTLYYKTTENFTVTLSSLAGATGTSLTGTATISNTNAAPTLAINSVSVNSTAGTEVFTVTRTGLTELATTFNYATADGTATAGVDYTAESSSGSIAANGSSTNTTTLSIPIINVANYNPNDTYYVNLSSLGNAASTGNTLQGTGTIINSTAAPTLSINNVSVTEGNGGATSATFTVTRTGGSDLAINYNCATADGTAIAGTDYTATNGSNSFTPGSGNATETITVPLLNTLSYKPTENFTITLSGATNIATSGNTLTGTATVMNTDSLPTLSINNVSVTEGSGGATSATFTVTRTGGTDLAVNYNFATADGTALAGTDYTSISGSNSFTPSSGNATETITVSLLNTLYYKPTENFTVNLSSISGATGTTITGTATVTNTDAAPTIAINNVTVNPSLASNAIFTITRTGLTELPVTFNYATANDGATAGVDYTSTSGSGSVAANASSSNTTTISVPVANLANYNPSDLFFVNLTSLANAASTGNTTQGLGTITNTTPAPTLSINNISVTEGSGGSTSATFTVTRTGGSDLAINYNFATTDGTALAGTDYTSTSGSNSFTAGSGNATETITVPLLNTLYYKPTENFTVSLSGATNIAGSGNTLTGTATITNTDSAPTVAINNVSVNANAGTEIFTVTRTGLTEFAATFNYATANGTATAGVDYTSTSGAGSIAANTSSTNTTTITVPIINVANYNPNDYYYVNLSNLNNAASTGNTLQGTGTIINNTAAPTLSINSVSASEGLSGATNVTFTVTRTGGTDLAANYNFATADGTALGGTDYTTTSGSNSFIPSSGNATETITVPLLNTLAYKPTETFTASLSGISGATGGTLTGMATITNTNTAPTVSISSPTVDPTQSSVETFTVTRTGLTTQLLTFHYATQNGAATAGVDYTAENGTGSIAAGGATGTTTISVPINTTIGYTGATDNFFVNLSSLTNAAATGNTLTGDGTIAYPAPTLSVSNITVDPSQTTHAIFTVTRTGLTTVSSVFNYTTADGTATSGGGDYSATSGTLDTINGGGTTASVTISVGISGTVGYKPNDYFFLDISNLIRANPTGSSLVGQATLDFPAPTVTVQNATFTENNQNSYGFVTVNIVRNGFTTLPVNLIYATADGTATINSGDYAQLQNPDTIAAGGASATIQETILIPTNLNYNPNEYFYVNLSNVTNVAATGNNLQGTVQIVNTNPAPTLSINNVQVVENSGGGVNAVFTVTRSGWTDLPVAFNFATANGLGTASGTDYTATSGSGTIAAGNFFATTTVTVPLLFNSSYTPGENFSVNLSNATNIASSGNNEQGLGYILNSGAAPTVSVSSPTITDISSGTESVVFNVTRTGTSNQPISFHYYTADGPNTIGTNDYAPVSGDATIAAGGSSATTQIAVTVNGSLNYNPNEYFFLNLIDLTNAASTGNNLSGKATVINNNPAPTLSVQNVTVNVPIVSSPGYIADGTMANVVVTVTGATDLPVTFNYSTSDGGAVAGFDYLPTSGIAVIAPGQTSFTINVPIIPNLDYNPNDQFSFHITNPLNIASSGNTLNSTVTLIDPNSTAPTITVNNVSVVTNSSGQTDAVFTVTRLGWSGAVTFNYSTADGTATTGSGAYTAVSGTATIGAGNYFGTTTITVPVNAADPVGENFFINLSNVTHVSSTGNNLQGTATTVSTAPPTLSLSVVDLTGALAGDFEVIVTSSAVSSQPIDFQYNFSDGTALSNLYYRDYTTITIGNGSSIYTNAGTIPAGQTTFVSALFPILTDIYYNTNPYFYFNLITPTNVAQTGNTLSVAIPILSTAAEPVLFDLQGASTDTNILFGFQTLTDAAGANNLVAIGAESENPISITFSTQDGTALTANNDYYPVFNLTSVYTPNQGANFSLLNQNTHLYAPYFLYIPVSANQAPSTYFYVDYSNLTNVLSPVTPSSTAINIITYSPTGFNPLADSNPNPTLSINNISVTEGAVPGTTNATFTVTESSPSNTSVSFNYATADGVGLAGTDYVATSGAITLAPGQTSATITVTVIDTNVYNPSDNFYVNLSNLTNTATVGNTTQGTATLNNNTPAPTISVSNISVTEGPSGATNATFTVTRTGGSDLAVNYNFATANGTATAGLDYTATSGTDSFAPSSGNATETITVALLNTLFYKPTETFNINLSGATNIASSGNTLQATATVINTDAAPSLSINSVSVNPSMSSNAIFTVTRTGLTELATTYNFTTANDGATAGIDYTATSGSGSIAANASMTNTATISVPVANLANYNPSDLFFVNLSSLGNAASTGNTLQGTGTIINNTAAPTLSINNISVSEGPSGATSATFTVTRTGGSDLAVNYNFATADGTALAGLDYTSTSGSNIFTSSSGNATETITVPLLNTLYFKPTETFSVNLTGTTNIAAIGNTLTGTATITNTDAAPTISINSVSANSTAGTEIFTVTRTGLTELATTFNYATADGTATAGVDYTATSGSGSIATNSSSTNTTTISVPIANIANYNPNDTFFVNLSNLANAAATGNTLQGTGTIINNTAAPTLSINNISVTEGPSGATSATFTVTRTGGSDLAVNYNFATADGTALAGLDYTSTSGSNIFTPSSGNATETITVPLLNTLYFKPTETFSVNLSGGTNIATTGNTLTGTATVTNTDAAPTVSINSVSANSTAGTEIFTVTRTGLTELATTFNYATADGTATAGIDYTTTSGSGSIAANSSSTNTTTLSVSIINVANYNPNDTFFLNLSNLANAAATGNTLQGTGTIINNTTAPTLSINNVSVTEGSSGATSATFTVTRTGGTDLAINYNFATADGTALAGLDYTSTSGSNIFTPSSGNAIETITVPLLNTLYYKPSETFNVNLTGATNIAPTGNMLTGTGTITNTDAAPTISINSVSANSTAGSEIFTVTRTRPN